MRGVTGRGRRKAPGAKGGQRRGGKQRGPGTKALRGGDAGQGDGRADEQSRDAPGVESGRSPPRGRGQRAVSVPPRLPTGPADASGLPPAAGLAPRPAGAASHPPPPAPQPGAASQAPLPSPSGTPDAAAAALPYTPPRRLTQAGPCPRRSGAAICLGPVPAAAAPGAQGLTPHLTRGPHRPPAASSEMSRPRGEAAARAAAVYPPTPPQSRSPLSRLRDCSRRLAAQPGGRAGYLAPRCRAGAAPCGRCSCAS